MLASDYGHTETVKLLSMMDIEVNIQDKVNNFLYYLVNRIIFNDVHNSLMAQLL